MGKSNLKLIRYLKGFSGCKLILYSSKGDYFVRKISKSKEYNKRLSNQMMKQEDFYDNFSTKEISTPRVLNQGYINGLFFFDMEYINGFTLVEYISRTTTQELKEISKVLFRIISIIKRVPIEKTKVSLSKKVSEKVEQIILRTPKEAHKVVLAIKNKSKGLPEIETTFCHGDLTLENIIYDENRKRYYLIDFLDNFVDHYWFDITKLFQDIEGEWYMFRNPSLDKKNMKSKMDFIKKVLLKLRMGDYIKYQKILLSLNFARILPYAKRDNFPYLIKNISKNLSNANPY